MQLLADGSEESPGAAGLGWLGGFVRALPRTSGAVRVPHVGWNRVTFQEPLGDYRKGDVADFYFDHSFAYVNPVGGRTVGACQHGISFTAVVRKDNIVAVQFHPEKSQASGLRVLRGFLKSS